MFKSKNNDHLDWLSSTNNLKSFHVKFRYKIYEASSFKHTKNYIHKLRSFFSSNAITLQFLTIKYTDTYIRLPNLFIK